MSLDLPEYQYGLIIELSSLLGLLYDCLPEQSYVVNYSITKRTELSCRSTVIKTEATLLVNLLERPSLFVLREHRIDNMLKSIVGILYPNLKSINKRHGEAFHKTVFIIHTPSLRVTLLEQFCGQEPNLFRYT